VRDISGRRSRINDPTQDRRGHTLRRPHKGTQSRGEFVEVRGFHDVVVGVAVEPGDPVQHGITGGVTQSASVHDDTHDEGPWRARASSITATTWRVMTRHGTWIRLAA
jgi:hypothetical protein